MIDYSKHDVWAEMKSGWRFTVQMALIPPLLAPFLCWALVSVGLWVWRGFRSG